MKRHSIFAASAMLAAFAAVASATPIPNGAHVTTRIFDDCPVTSITVTNNYPSTVAIDETNMICSAGFANLHWWKFSNDGGASDLQFLNGDAMSFEADLVISGSGQGEAGLNIAPWWFGGDGRVNVRTTDGEIAVFGGRMPFHSFSAPANGNVRYTKGNPIHIKMTFNPNGLSAASRATMQYQIVYLGNTHTSPAYEMDQGNASEDPPHGLWGILQPATAGGFLQSFQSQGTPDPSRTVNATWTNIQFSVPTATKSSSWGRLKNLYR